MFSNLRRYRLLVALAAVYVVLSFLLRTLLWWRFGSDQGVGVLDLPVVLATGLINDWIEAFYLFLPLSFYLWLVPERWHGARWHKGLLAVGTYLTLIGLVYLEAAEYFFFEEFDARFNLVAVDYLIYPHEVFINIWESYPVSWFLVADLSISALLMVGLWRFIQPRPEDRMSAKARTGVFAAHVGAVALLATTFSTGTLAHSDNRITNELAVNGVSSFFRALRTNELDYMRHYRVGDSAEMFRRVAANLSREAAAFTHLGERQLDRRHTGTGAGLGKRNVVVIVEESFGSNYIGVLGGERGLTPAFDSLASEGLLFTHAYASGTRTVRGLEAITLSFPPIPSESVVKRPGSEGMANWGEVMKAHGYQASFLYGGYGYFDNMNHFYETNGFAVSDRTEIEDQTFANIWGVCDEDLFRHAIKYFNTRPDDGRPFFSLIMTTSNHKPYTFPKGVPGVAPEGGGRAAGIRYADYALGRFFEMAREQSWYDDTLFVVVADHGARVYGRAEIPLKSYEIPLLVIAPGAIEPSRVETPVSQLDVAPTVLGLLGLPYEAPFFGQDVLAGPASHPLLFNHNHKVALYQDGEIAVLGLQQSAETYRYDMESDTYSAMASPNRELIELATAYYQTAFEQFRDHRYVMTRDRSAQPERYALSGQE